MHMRYESWLTLQMMLHKLPPFLNDDTDNDFPLLLKVLPFREPLKCEDFLVLFATLRQRQLPWRRSWALNDVQSGQGLLMLLIPFFLGVRNAVLLPFPFQLPSESSFSLLLSESSTRISGHPGCKYALVITRSASSRCISLSRRCEHLVALPGFRRPLRRSAASQDMPSGHQPRRTCSFELHCLSQASRRWLSVLVRPTLRCSTSGFSVSNYNEFWGAVDGQ